MSIADVNWLATVVAAVSAFVVGGLWYGPLFGKVWMRENGLTEQQLAARSPAPVYGGSLLLAFIASVMLEAFIGPEATLGFGALAGFLVGIGWVATLTAIQYLFEMRSGKLFLINGGYSVITLTVMGTILGAW